RLLVFPAFLLGGARPPPPNTITKKITLQNYPKFKLNGVLYMAFTNLVKYRFVSPPKAKTNL
ncbi:MAG: hypothetical protein ACK571_13845, partial [Pseudanabaena sp.]